MMAQICLVRAGGSPSTDSSEEIAPTPGCTLVSRVPGGVVRDPIVMVRTRWISNCSGSTAATRTTHVTSSISPVAIVCPSDVLVKLRSSLSDLEETLRGNQTPGEEKTGLLESGQALAKKLKQIGTAAQ